MATEQKLRECPFCPDGGDPAWAEGEQKTKYGNEQAYCRNCFASTAPESSKEGAAKWWNTRSSTSDYRLGVEDAVAVLKKHDAEGCAVMGTSHVVPELSALLTSEQGAPQENEPLIWLCSCGEHNDRDRKVCRRCGLSKPVSTE